MTGRFLHDALLRVLADWSLREPLMNSVNGTPVGREAEWHIIKRIPEQTLANMARFLARHYYAERIVRLFRHVRRLSLQTGRDPRIVLDFSEAQVCLDRAVIGSRETADAIVGLIETYLCEDDEAIQARFPYWRDLIHYQETMFRLEARRQASLSSSLPCHSSAARVVRFEWDLPAIIAALRATDHPIVEAMKVPTLLLIAASSDQQVTTLRCSPPLDVLFNAADGTRTVVELALKAGIPRREAESALQQMKAIGAIEWKEER